MVKVNMNTKSKLKVILAALKTKPGKAAAKAAAKSLINKYVKPIKKKS
jgi:hypothetical protein